MNPKDKVYLFFTVLLFVALACNTPFSSVAPTEETIEQSSPLAEVDANMEQEQSVPVSIEHIVFPSSDFGTGRAIFDTESSGTAPEKRAPYGDAYDLNFLERPFLADMTYVPDLDIKFFSMNKDEEWHYVSIKLIGFDPNNPLGINYAVELDTDKDGFGNYIIWAQPPYTTEWTTENVQVFADENRNTSGASPLKSDAPFSSDGYEKLLFDGGQGIGDDPDLAWVRLVNNENATIQFAFKRSMAGDVFLAGVMADAGLKDVTQLDYVDRFTEAEAGSPVRSKQAYPLKALHSVDNTCREAFGFSATGYEPMICPKNIAPPAAAPGGSSSSNPPSSAGCDIIPSDCTADAPFYYGYPACACSATPYYEYENP
jgi:hypothetical protein